MGQASTGDVLFVGSVPGTSAEEVFRRCARAVGAHAFAFPDGELGPRQMWVGALGELAYARHPGLERLPDTVLPFGSYRPRPADVSFDDVYPYADVAVASYRTFRRLRDAGEVPEGARFQVSLPTAHAAIASYFPDVERWPDLFAAWSRAMSRGFDRMLAEIPAEDLVVQLDYCTEFVDICGVMDDMTEFNIERSRAERVRAHTDPTYLAPMSEGLPHAVALGYHVCLGTWPRWPLAPQDDLSLVVEVANQLVAGTPRPVDFLHLPATPDAGDAYFAPLRDLTPGPKVFLGLECRDGADGVRRRSEAAARHVADFGIAHFCGYGREDAHRIDELLADIAAGAAALQPAPAS